MDLAKPGLIKQHCLPNAIFTFAEYLFGFGDEELKQKGTALIQKMNDHDLDNIALKKRVETSLKEIKAGKRDIYI